jgi:hypothetical protein
MGAVMRALTSTVELASTVPMEEISRGTSAVEDCTVRTAWGAFALAAAGVGWRLQERVVERIMRAEIWRYGDTGEVFLRLACGDE